MPVLLVSHQLHTDYGANLADRAQRVGMALKLVVLPADPEARARDADYARLDFAFFSNDAFAAIFFSRAQGVCAEMVTCVQRWRRPPDLHRNTRTRRTPDDLGRRERRTDCANGRHGRVYRMFIDNLERLHRGTALVNEVPQVPSSTA